MDISPLIKVSEAKKGGSVAAHLSNAEVRELLSAYGDGVLRCRGIDIRVATGHVSFRACAAMRCFIDEYGIENAVAITNRFFSPPYCGTWRGNSIDWLIYTKKWRWLANNLLSEAKEASRGPAWSSEL